MCWFGECWVFTGGFGQLPAERNSQNPCVTIGLKDAKWSVRGFWCICAWCLLDGTPCGQNTLKRDFFLDTFILVHTSHCGSRCRTTCLHKTCSSTCHHKSERLLFPCCVFFLCLSCLYFLSHFYLFSVLNFSIHDVENAEHQTQCAPAKRGVLPRGDIQPSHRL